MIQAHLPDELYEDLIGHMKVGARGWTVPWAMHVDDNGALWLNTTFTIHPQPHGTVSMLVRHSRNGYEVEMRDHSGWQYKWSPGKSRAGDSDFEPVVKFTRRDK